MRLVGVSGWVWFMLAFLALWAATSAPACADVTDFDHAQDAVVQVRMQAAEIEIRTWNRPLVEIQAPLTVHVRRTTVELPAISQVPILQGRIRAEEGTVTLPQETFVITPLAAGPHDVINVGGLGRVVLTVPRGVPLIIAVVSGRGSVTLTGYRGGTFVARVRNGRARLRNVQGVGFVQVMHGPIVIANSDFTRLRARTGVGNIILEHSSARQIQISSIDGSIVSDDGTFQPGLAQFDSQNGFVAIGASNDVTVNAHSLNGKIHTLFNGPADVQSHDAGTGDTVVIGRGGPVVTAASGAGDIFLYDGALSAHAPLPPDWSAVQSALHPRPTALPFPLAI
ncbi:MAG TPA: hypothetical protein VME66_08725 [Candidatus Acidoferrales bacterium]|nr:hypothetical protein [Candidatus Acidoferrales bacterium]